MNTSLAMPSAASLRRRSTLGFSLIELMVGLVLGMIAVIVVMQIFSLSNQGQRTATSGDDAQTNGALAVAQLQREIRQSGQGISNRHLLGCNLLMPGGTQLNGLGRVFINHASIPAGDANTDTLLVISGSGNGSPEGTLIIPTPAALNYPVATPTAFNLNDFVIAAWRIPPAACTVQLDRVAAIPVGPNITVTTGGVATPEVLFNLGQAPQVLVYAVRGGRLTQCNFMAQNCTNAAAANWVPIIDDVVSLRMQYVRAGDTFDQTQPDANCASWATLLGLRLAITTRSGQLEKTNVTVAANSPVWAGSADLAIDLSGNTAWQRYRYRVFEAVVPLRNNASC